MTKWVNVLSNKNQKCLRCNKKTYVDKTGKAQWYYSGLICKKCYVYDLNHNIEKPYKNSVNNDIYTIEYTVNNADYNNENKSIVFGA